MAPQPSPLLQTVSLVVIGASAVVAGGLLAMADADEPLAEWPLGDWPFCLAGILCVGWLVWIQVLGTFAPHERRANEAGNWLIGLSALAAIGLAATPFVRAQPLEWISTSQVAALVTALFFAGTLNLRWARQLRRLEWSGASGWKFSIRELLVITTAVAVCLGSYLLLRK